MSQQELQGWFIRNGRLQERLTAMLASSTLYQEVFESAESGPEPHSVEFQLHGMYRDGGQFVPAQRDIRMRVFHVRDANSKLIGRGKIFQDVTKEHQAERIKSNLLAIVSHELRTPLTAIKGYATGLLDETDSEIDLKWQRHSLGRIVDESNRLADLVTNLLDMSQVEAGTLKLYPELYFLSALVEEAITLAFAQEDRHCVHVDLPERLPLLNADRRRIVVVLRNILENARRYGGRHLLVELKAIYEEQPAPHHPGLTVTITDNGPGIPTHLTDRIFDHFYQVENGHERNRNSVGLGLAICRGFVEAHHGRIWATNRIDGKRGAVFHLWFPPSMLHVHASQLLEL
jgi:K+-sensing histidine kinase KdpD